VGEPGTRLLALTTPMPVGALAWSPDGRYLVAVGTGSFSGIGSVAIVDTHTDGAMEVVDRNEAISDGLAISADGRFLAVGGGEAKGVLTMPKAEPFKVDSELAVAQRVAFSPDGRFVASAGWTTGFVAGPQIWVYDAKTGDFVWRDGGSFDTDNERLALAYSPDSRFLAAIVNAEAFLYNAKTGDRLLTLPPTVSSIVFTPDSRFLVAGMNDGRCVMLDVETLTPHEGRVHDLAAVGALAVSADARWVAAVVEPGPAVLNGETGERRFGPRPDVNECTRVTFGPDLRTIAVNQLPGDTPVPGVAVLDAATGADVWSDRCPDLAADLAFSPDGSRVAIGGIATETEGYLRVYDTGAERVRIPHDSPLTWLAMARTPDPVVAAATGDGKVRSYRVKTGGEPLIEAVHPSPVTSVSISPDGLFVATGCLDGKARMVKALFGTLWELDHGQAVNAVAISAAGDLVATACADRTARILAVTDGAEKSRCPHQGVVTAAVFSPDGTILATASNRTTTIVDVATGQALHTVTGAGRVRALAFDRDGRLATGNEDGRVQVVDPGSGTVLGTVTHPRPVSALAFSKDGTRLATGGADRTVRISAMSGGVPAEKTTLTLAAPVVALAFHPTDQALAVLTEAPTVSVYETETGFERFRLGHPAPVRDLAFTADGTLLVTACDDGVLRVFDGRTS
jgi:WD40 repeat protein